MTDTKATEPLDEPPTYSSADGLSGESTDTPLHFSSHVETDDNTDNNSTTNAEGFLSRDPEKTLDAVAAKNPSETAASGLISELTPVDVEDSKSINPVKLPTLGNFPDLNVNSDLSKPTDHASPEYSEIPSLNLPKSSSASPESSLSSDELGTSSPITPERPATPDYKPQTGTADVELVAEDDAKIRDGVDVIIPGDESTSVATQNSSTSLEGSPSARTRSRTKAVQAAELTSTGSPVLKKLKAIKESSSDSDFSSSSASTPIKKSSSTGAATSSSKSTPMKASKSQTTPSKSKRTDSPQRRRRRSSAASVSSTNSDIEAVAAATHNTPSSHTTSTLPVPEHPANIFRNLLIMEDTYRQEYVLHRKMRRKYLLFNFVMMALGVLFFYGVFIEPSRYGVIHFFNRLILMIVVITIILFYISGSYHKTLGTTRKFIYNSNKAMRGFNVKLVRIPQAWSEAFIDWFWCPAYAKRPGMVVKLVLSPRVFNPDIIEGWELYRMEYWNKEYARLQSKTTGSSSTTQRPNSSKKNSPSISLRPEKSAK